MNKIIIGLLLIGLVLVAFGCSQPQEPTSDVSEDQDVSDLAQDVSDLDSSLEEDLNNAGLDDIESDLDQLLNDI